MWQLFASIVTFSRNLSKPLKAYQVFDLIMTNPTLRQLFQLFVERISREAFQRLF